jgi:hypothetical protein
MFFPIAIIVFAGFLVSDGKVIPDSLVSEALNHYKERCLSGHDFDCGSGNGRGKHELRALGCNIYGTLQKYFEKETSIVKRTYIVEFAGSFVECDSSPAPLLRLAMKDTVLEIAVDASTFYAFRKFSNAIEILREQIHSKNLNQRLGAVLGLQSLGKNAVPALLDAFSMPDDSVRNLLYSLKWFSRPTNAGPVYVMENDPTPIEMEALDLKYNSTFHRYTQSVINKITGEQMDGDTTRIKEWITKQTLNKKTKSGQANTLFGKVCVGGLPLLNSLDAYFGSKPRPNSRSIFRIILDGHDSLVVTSDSGAVFPNVDTSIIHRLKITMDGKPRESFKFSFKKKGSASLCLFYSKPHGTWSLEPLAGREGKCGCLED